MISLRFPRLQRDAALFFEGTEDLKITGCTIERVDGNAVMLSGYTRGAVIERNEFTYISVASVTGGGFMNSTSLLCCNIATDTSAIL